MIDSKLLERPPITAPMIEHRRWVVNMLDTIRDLERKLGSLFPQGDKLALAKRRLDLWEQVMQAFVDGVDAEKKTKDFKLNEFGVADSQHYYIEIDEYADRSMPDPPRYRVKIIYDENNGPIFRVLELQYLEPHQLCIDTQVARNINSEGP